MIVQSDARRMPLADCSVQMICTSPPYWGLRQYADNGNSGIGLEPTLEEYLAHMVEFGRECWRVLRDDGTLWLNMGDAYAGSVTGADRPPEPGHTREANGRVKTGQEGKHRRPDSGLKPKDLIGLPWRVAFALQADGWYLRQDIIWAKPNPMPESVRDRCTKAHEYLFLMTKKPRYYYDAEAVKETGAGRENFGHGQVKCHANKDRNDAGRKDMTIKGYRNRRDVWTIPTAPYRGAHFATFPPALVEPCVLAGSPVGGIVLDPFCGSGTVGQVARKHGRRFVGLDLSWTYLHDLALVRAEGLTPPSALEQTPMFGGEKDA